MTTTFIGSAPENFRVGRPAGLKPGAIVLHRSGGSRDVLRARFNDPASSLSAHYVVCRDGAVDQYVLETDTAFHAGVAVNAAWSLLRPNVNPNFYTVGIELEGTPDSDWPDAQLAACAAVIGDVAGRWQILVDADHVVPHSAIRASSRCPAATCPLDRLISAAQVHAQEARVPQRTVVRTLSRTNVRRGSPSVQAPVVRVLPAQSDVAVRAFTTAGERVQGNASWYGLEDNQFFWAGATDVPDPTDSPVLSGAEATPSPSTDAMESGSPAPASPPAAEVPGLAIDRTTFALASKEYFVEPTRKDLVVLHFTAGKSAKSAFDTWRNDPQHVATAYIVDVDGTIYEMFPPEFWACHLGVKGTANVHDRRSIGIEMANAGPLMPSATDPSVLNWWPPASKDAPQFTTRFCGVDETGRYVKAEYRGMAHFAAFPGAQVDAVASLVRRLCDRFSIPPTLPPLARRFTCDLNGYATYGGVCSHANFRQDKWDIGPAFPWERLGL